MRCTLLDILYTLYNIVNYLMLNISHKCICAVVLLYDCYYLEET